MMMISLDLPPGLSVFFNGIFEFVTFALIPTDDIYDVIEPDLLHEAYSEQAENIGYESHYLTHNSGTISFMIVCLFLQ